jgi:hypothetical protein
MSLNFGLENRLGDFISINVFKAGPKPVMLFSKIKCSILYLTNSKNFEYSLQQWLDSFCDVDL